MQIVRRGGLCLMVDTRMCCVLLWDGGAVRYCSALIFFFREPSDRLPPAPSPYYDKTQRLPHAQSDRDVSHLAKKKCSEH